MKRTITAVAVLLITSLLVSVPVCAQAKGGGNTAGEKGTKAGSRQRKAAAGRLEFTVTPAIGLSATGAQLKSEHENGSFTLAITQFDLGLQATMIGFPVDKKSGRVNNFTLILNMDIGVGGKMTLKGNNSESSASINTGSLFQIHAIAGYKFEPKQNLYITPGIGLGFTNAVLDTTDRYTGAGAGGFSIPLYADLKYFFSDLVGIDVNIINTLGFGTVGAGYGYYVGNFHNTFVLKVGPVFRF